MLVEGEPTKPESMELRSKDVRTSTNLEGDNLLNREINVPRYDIYSPPHTTLKSFSVGGSNKDYLYKGARSYGSCEEKSETPHVPRVKRSKKKKKDENSVSASKDRKKQSEKYMWRSQIDHIATDSIHLLGEDDYVVVRCGDPNCSEMSTISKNFCKEGPYFCTRCFLRMKEYIESDTGSVSSSRSKLSGSNSSGSSKPLSVKKEVETTPPLDRRITKRGEKYEFLVSTRADLQCYKELSKNFNKLDMVFDKPQRGEFLGEPYSQKDLPSAKRLSRCITSYLAVVQCLDYVYDRSSTCVGGVMLAFEGAFQCGLPETPLLPPTPFENYGSIVHFSDSAEPESLGLFQDSVWSRLFNRVGILVDACLPGFIRHPLITCNTVLDKTVRVCVYGESCCLIGNSMYAEHSHSSIITHNTYLGQDKKYPAHSICMTNNFLPELHTFYLENFSNRQLDKEDQCKRVLGETVSSFPYIDAIHPGDQGMVLNDTLMVFAWDRRVLSSARDSVLGRSMSNPEHLTLR